MPSNLEQTRHLLDYAFQTMKGHCSGLSLDEALFVPQGGYRSVLGTLKHAAGWSHVYRSYAFDPQPKHWAQLDWPHGLRDTIIKSEQYLQDIIAWFDDAHRRWLEDLAEVSELRLLHWGQRAPLYEIVVIMAGHHLYHAGELNQVLSICRGEAWEETEEVEENNISTIGHRVKPPWLDDNQR
ncbi:MAG TPA: DinB family protein [Anaerolineales bacterium]